jgi:acetyl-CoA C-acetyltransferase
MRRAAIVSPLRTPVGAFGGALRDVPVETLGSSIVNAVLERTRLDPALVEDMSFAQSYANSETPCVGRWIALEAGLPIEVPGLQLDRRCGGGLQAILTAAMMVQTGACDVVLAGGVESMSRIEYYTTDMRWGKRSGTTQFYDRLDRGRERSQPVHRFGHISGMIETAETLAREYRVSREEADAFAAESHRRAAAAWDDGRFAEEVVPVLAPQRKGDPVAVTRDEGIRSDSTPETLAKLRPIIRDGTVTAGNAAQQNDAAAACLVVAEDRCGQAVPEDRPRLQGHGSGRDQRGVRGAGARCPPGLGVGRPGEAQRQRIGYLARPSDRCDRRADHDDAHA